MQKPPSTNRGRVNGPLSAVETDVVGEIVDMMYAEITEKEEKRITEKWICFVLNITQKPFSYIRKEFFEYNST